MSTYLVTGAAGFVGSHLVEALLAQGHEVRGVDSFTPYYARDLKEANLAAAGEHPSFRLVEGDLTDPAVECIFDGLDGIYHLAAQAGVRTSWRRFDVYLRDNLLATQVVFENAVRTRTRVVFVSSSSVYGNAEAYPTPESTPPSPIAPYGVTKLACENLARAYRESGLEAISLRYFTVYGPRQRPDMAFTRIAHSLISGDVFELYGTGEQTRDVTYVGDAVSATIGAMDLGVEGAIYNVGGGSETSLNEAISVFSRLSDRDLAVIHRDVARGDVKRTASDTTAIRRDVGWEPRTSFEEGIAAQLEWASAAFTGAW